MFKTAVINYLSCHYETIPFVGDIAVENRRDDDGAIDEDGVGQVLCNGNATGVTELNKTTPRKNKTNTVI